MFEAGHPHDDADPLGFERIAWRDLVTMDRQREKLGPLASSNVSGTTFQVSPKGHIIRVPVMHHAMSESEHPCVCLQFRCANLVSFIGVCSFSAILIAERITMKTVLNFSLRRTTFEFIT
jgi:hypothetical protein